MIDLMLFSVINLLTGFVFCLALMVFVNAINEQASK